MEKASVMAERLRSGGCDEALGKLYGEAELPEQRERYAAAALRFAELYGDTEIAFFSAPGRTEIGGNHTDHQHGCVLAAAVGADVIAAAAPAEDSAAAVYSEGYGALTIDLNNTTSLPGERGTTAALVRGTAAALREYGLSVGGFRAYVTGAVPAGSGLSSSAAFEVLVGSILSGLYNGGTADPVLLARAGQRAENEWFGKPCGLMDQMASAVGGLVEIDFRNPAEPVVEKLAVNFDDFGHSLCIVDTGSSHADLTDAYAAIPAEMKAVAEYFGREVLREVDEMAILWELPALRKKLGDRAVLRALHFTAENRRAVSEAEALKQDDFAGFLQLVRESGRSSRECLQNISDPMRPEQQSLALALTLSERVLGACGACRVHGGGFAGTIQTFVPEERVESYRTEMDRIFGLGACRAMRIRPLGGTRVL